MPYQRLPAFCTCCARFPLPLLFSSEGMSNECVTIHSRPLIEHGRIVRVRRTGRPTMIGGWFALQAVAMALGALWGPLGRIGRKVPILKIAYSFELDGRQYHVAELISADEAVALDDTCEAVASVDPHRPRTRHFLYKAKRDQETTPQSSSAKSKWS